jgi:hypothetical protein
MKQHALAGTQTLSHLRVFRFLMHFIYDASFFFFLKLAFLQFRLCFFNGSIV